MSDRPHEGGAQDKRNLGRSSRRTALRDAKIVADKGRGMAWADIAMGAKLSISHCKEIERQWREDGLGDSAGFDPVQEVLQVIDMLGQAVRDWAKLESETTQESILVAARRSKVEHGMSRLQLMINLGVIPAPHMVNAAAQLQEILSGIVALTDKHDVPEAFLEDLERYAEETRSLGVNPAFSRTLLG